MATYLPRIRTRLMIHAHRKVVGLLDGEYASLQTGRSMDFHDLRGYVPGDDVKDIDWKATARSRTLLVKRFAAERQHLVLLAISTGRSMAAQATGTTTKRDLAIFTAGLVGWLGVRHGDKVAVAYGDSSVQKLTKPADTEIALERALGLAHDATSVDAAEADIVAVLRHIAANVRRRAILLVVTDEHELSEEMATVLRRLTVQHEVLVAGIDDLDPTAAVTGSGPTVDVDTVAALPGWLSGDAVLQAQYAELAATEEHGLRGSLDRLGIAYQRVRDDSTAIGAIFHLLERHRHARR